MFANSNYNLEIEVALKHLSEGAFGDQRVYQYPEVPFGQQ